MENPHPSQKKRRRDSMRLRGWNYAAPGYYFVTICTKDKMKYFGRIRADKMLMNAWGKAANKFWQEIPAHFDYIGLDEFVIMPNHIHGIIIIGEVESSDDAVGVRHALPPRALPTRALLHQGKACLAPTDGTNGRKFHNQGKKTLSSIVGSYKSVCTQAIRAHVNDFAWQDNFYDRIIRDEKELYNIRRYIRENPLRWEKDEYYR